jgi:hypothetical protein
MAISITHLRKCLFVSRDVETVPHIMLLWRLYCAGVLFVKSNESVGLNTANKSDYLHVALSVEVSNEEP